MSYLNGNIGYRDDLLINRSIVKKGNYALIEQDGVVINSIPGFENCDLTILGSPKLGASFVDYLITIHDGGSTVKGYAGDGVEVFLYIIEGDLNVSDGEKDYKLTSAGYIYCPGDFKLHFNNTSGKDVKGFLYKRRYEKLEGYSPEVVVNNINNLEWTAYEGMEDALIKDLLPSGNNFAYDFNIHIFSFKPGASHGFIETHYQEHGALCLSGKGMYNLGNEWVPVKKGDYIYMDSYSLQACYAVGRDEDFSYIYSKDCNRDVYI